jgi:hypothetical protein
MPGGRVVAALVAVVCVAGCSRSGPADVPTGALPGWVVAACAAVPDLRSGCVDREPRVEGDVWWVAIVRSRPGYPLSYVVLRHGFDSPGTSPPQFASVVEAAGSPRALRRAFGLAGGGARRWGGLNGRLYRTGPPARAPFRDLVAFAWRDGVRLRVVAIGAAGPAVATLRAIVRRRPASPRAIRELVPAGTAGGLAMVETPRWVSLLCRREQPHACPARLPRPDGPTTLVQVTPAHAVDVSWGAPTGRASRDRPPGLVHLTVSRSLRHAAAPAPHRGDVAALPAHGYPRAPVGLGVRHWTAVPGALSLGARDCFGDHLCYRWPAGGRSRLISLHAWRPLPQALAVFAAVVCSVPAG